jgi:hypothetical protein
MRISRRLAVLGLMAVAFGGVARLAHAYPEPNVVPTSWELDVEIKTPRTIAVTLPGSTTARLFWYMTYTVTNRSGEDQLFIPDVWMFTDTGDLIQANRAVPPTVFARIKEQTKNNLLESPTQVVGTLLQGPDNAKESVAIWPVPDKDVKHVSIYFAGLSGESHNIKAADGKEVQMRKTLMLDYDTPGDLSHQAGKPFAATGKRWILR